MPHSLLFLKTKSVDLFNKTALQVPKNKCHCKSYNHFIHLKDSCWQYPRYQPGTQEHGTPLPFRTRLSAPPMRWWQTSTAEPIPLPAPWSPTVSSAHPTSHKHHGAMDTIGQVRERIACPALQKLIVWLCMQSHRWFHTVKCYHWKLIRNISFSGLIEKV